MTQNWWWQYRSSHHSGLFPHKFTSVALSNWIFFFQIFTVETEEINAFPSHCVSVYITEVKLVRQQFRGVCCKEKFRIVLNGEFVHIFFLCKKRISKKPQITSTKTWSIQNFPIEIKFHSSTANIQRTTKFSTAIIILYFIKRTIRNYHDSQVRLHFPFKFSVTWKSAVRNT